MVAILPSIASASQLNLKGEMDKIQGTSYLHVDIEDGNFVPNITFGMKTVKAVCEYGKEFSKDAHLLVTNPMDYIDDLLDLNFDAISFHIESMEYPLVGLNRIRKRGCKAGLAFNFKTSIDEALPFIDALDFVLIMCAEPDDLGDMFSNSMLKKIAYARSVLPEHISIYVDGGIGKDQLKQVVECGADHVVMGRAVWRSEDPKKAIMEFSK